MDALLKEILGNCESDPLQVALTECEILKQRVSALTEALHEKVCSVDSDSQKKLQNYIECALLLENLYYPYGELCHNLTP